MITARNIASSSSESPNQKQTNKFTCICCRVKFEHSDFQRIHFKSEWHLYNLKRKVCCLDPIDLDSFELIQASAPAKSDDDDYDYVYVKDVHELTDTDEHDNDDDDWEIIDDQDDEDEELAEILARVVKPDTCLFCGEQSSDMKKNLQHMNGLHGFFVPEEQYVFDLDGLVEYLGYKVGAGATCLWCHKEFTSLHGVRLHMIYKDHCKILYNQENAISEFKDFYDYSSQKSFTMKPLERLVVVKRKTPRQLPYQKKSPPGNFAAGTNQLVLRRGNSFALDSKLAKGARRFNQNWAKKSVRISLIGNQTRRARFRAQNPT